MTNRALPSTSEIQQQIAPTLLRPLPGNAYTQLGQYIQLLYRWNEKMNLTAVRDPEVLVRLHLTECILCGQQIPERATTVLDFGSGAGLPGIPIAIARPDLKITLAESQQKKAGFLREVIRELGLSNATVHSGRAELLAEELRFDAITLRAVDQMENALVAAETLLAPGGRFMVLTSEAETEKIERVLPTFQWTNDPISGSVQRILLIGQRR